ERSTFIFYRGELKAVYRKVKSKGHAEQLLNDLAKLV
ncbi:MAG: peroxiredoxin, partial [Acinetobacter sp.]|nr:peroxiredoxin [Acinetobacter sp.]